jgi:biopolymer transport protein ExbD
MPVHAAGPRTLISVKFKHLVTKTGAGVRSSNIALNLTPFVDMMTILVAFLLMVFSASNVFLQDQKGLDLPLAESRHLLQNEIPIIQVTKSEINFKGAQVTTVDQVLKDDSPTFLIEDLKEKLDLAHKEISEKVTRAMQGDFSLGRIDKVLLDSCEKAKQGLRPKEGEICPDGLAILQADKDSDVRVINRIVNTAKASGFDNLLFAVKNK